MTFTVKFFARLREELATTEVQVALADVTTLAQLKPFLIGQYPHWQTALERNLLLAVNQNLVNGDLTLQVGDEVALFPPVTGG
ncbi:MAG: molybdopterin converting factor subunit 1 [Reinekea sp.]|jgi:molybdopterin converting factor subunit 1